ncbi:MAG: flexitail domain-containing putative surface protein [Dehalococcoidia bacterium]
MNRKLLLQACTRAVPGVIAVMAGLFGLVASPVQAQPSPCDWPDCENAMSVSCAGPTAVGETVDVYVSVQYASTPYQGYKAVIGYDSSVVRFVPVGPWGVVYWLIVPEICLDCYATDVDVGGGLRQTGMQSGLVTSTTMVTGVLASVRYECVGPGWTSLRLVPPTGGWWTGTTTFGPGGVVIPTGLTGGWIECEGPTPTPTATPTPGPDNDGDGCTDSQELDMGLDPDAWYDFYDVPVPVYPDPTPNGTKNRAIAMDDMLAVLFYVGTYNGDGGSPNANGVAYDSVKGSCDWDGDTVADKEGLCYDRSPGAEPNPPWDAGPPDGAVSMDDVLAVLAQVGLSCIDPP